MSERVTVCPDVRLLESFEIESEQENNKVYLNGTANGISVIVGHRINGYIVGQNAFVDSVFS